MIRIISGKHKRQCLIAPAGGTVRPTSDRTRTALFNALGLWIQGKKVLDLFAGSGSVGYESISRGAEHITFVEKNPAALKSIRKNANYLKETKSIDICAMDVFKFLNSVNRHRAGRSGSKCEQSVGRPKAESRERKADEERQTKNKKQKSKIQNYYDFIYADPPFREADIFSLIENITLSEVAHKNTILVIEHEKRKEIIEGEIYSCFECYKNAKYGKAILSYFKVKSEK